MTKARDHNMAWNDRLTGRALGIAQSDSNVIRVLAGPGTGKSFALKRRLMRLLEEGTPPKSLLVVTFTRNSAADLVREIQELGVDGCEMIVASTLHSFCFRLLMKQAVYAITGRTPRPIVTFSKAGVLQYEAAPLLADIIGLGNFGNKRNCTKRIRAFEAVWARLQHEEPGWAHKTLDAAFERHLKSWLKFHRCMLIGELVPDTLHFLRNNPTSPELSRFQHVLVDEYQDLNKAEQVLIDLLSSQCAKGIVGDEDQSIYSFRHAHPAGIVEFGETHPNTDDHILASCRRCPQRVVRVADQLIRNNHPAHEGPRLQSRAKNPEGEVHIVQWPTLEQEATGICTIVKNLIKDKGYAPGDVLILCPRRHIGYGLRDALVEEGIATHSFYHEEALEEDEAQEAFALLTLLANIKDRVALRFWLGFGSQTWLSNQYAKVREHCESTGEDPFDVLDHGASSVTGISNLLKRFALLKKRIKKLDGWEGQELVDAIFPEDEDWCRSLREAASLGIEDNGSPQELHAYLTARITQPEMPEEGEYVRIMSLHKSKGLTSRAVILSGCIQGFIPFQNTDASEAEQQAILEEQRRLFYVAITRCTNLLILSSVATLPYKLAYRLGASFSGNYGNVRTIASRFLAELGPDAPAAITGVQLLKSKFNSRSDMIRKT